jgi:SAM-dependent methyltransferase
VPLWRSVRDKWTIAWLAIRVRRDPLPFVRRIAAGLPAYLRSRAVRLDGARALDAGTGGGAVPEALAAAGARPLAVDLDDHRRPDLRGATFVLARAERLPFRNDAFDLVVSSNVLEHVADAKALVQELARVCRPGGFVYLSWTTWYSPLGGHEMSPFHYLGPRLGMRAYRLVWRRPPRWNVPGSTLFPVHVGAVLRLLRTVPLRITDVAPRYWPSLRFLARIPGVREVAMWNCAILLQKPGVMPASAGPNPASTPGTPPGS